MDTCRLPSSNKSSVDNDDRLYGSERSATPPLRRLYGARASEPRAESMELSCPRHFNRGSDADHGRCRPAFSLSLMAGHFVRPLSGVYRRRGMMGRARVCHSMFVRRPSISTVRKVDCEGRIGFSRAVGVHHPCHSPRQRQAAPSRWWTNGARTWRRRGRPLAPNSAVSRAKQGSPNEPL